MTFISAPHLGQLNGSIPYTCLISAAPPLPSLLGAGSRHRVLGGGWRGLTVAFGSQPPALVRIESVVANQMLPCFGNVLRHLRQEIQRIKDLEIALRTGQQILAGSFRESSQPVVSCLGQRKSVNPLHIIFFPWFPGKSRSRRR